jgi:hypothetical protein
MSAFPALSARGAAAPARGGARAAAFAAGAAPLPLRRCRAAAARPAAQRAATITTVSKAGSGKTDTAQRELVFDAAPSPAPGASLARQLYTQDCEAAVNAQINVEVR